ncbi:hypothetical protein QBA54_40230 [Streptomyces sp. B21-108]|uniref:hypothetical protein n=1 Tax=Streptomyces sp. B21-108 TaxID=3039419 RepID=UPI002FF01242
MAPAVDVRRHLLGWRRAPSAVTIGRVLAALDGGAQSAGWATSGVPTDGPPTGPALGLSCLGRLVEAVTAAGLSVRHRQAGHARPLPTAVDLAAYRIIQEGLTNAHKHGAHAGAELLVE